MSASALASASAKRPRSAAQNGYLLPRNAEWTVRAIFKNPELAPLIASVLSKYDVAPGRVLPNAAVRDVLKEATVYHLKNHVFARLAALPYGVGVVAIRPIPKGTFPFQTLAGPCYAEDYTTLSKAEVRAVDSRLPRYLDDFFVVHNGEYTIPTLGMNSLDISYYLNHSDAPNMEIVYHPVCNFTVYRAARDIAVGEQLSINYCDFRAPKEELIQQFDPDRTYLKCDAEKRGGRTRSRVSSVKK